MASRVKYLVFNAIDRVQIGRISNVYLSTSTCNYDYAVPIFFFSFLRNVLRQNFGNVILINNTFAVQDNLLILNE